MTGRDYKKLVKLHRDTIQKTEAYTNDNFRYLTKLIDNTSLIKKYTPIDYNLYKNFIGERKQAANESINKVKQLENNNKLKKENLFSQHHSVIWLKEWSKLDNQYKSSELELEDLFKLLELNSVDYIDLKEPNSIVNENDDEEVDHFFKDNNPVNDLELYRENLYDERIKFKLNTIYPINELKEDLEYYLRVTPVKDIREKNIEKNQKIFSMINQVKSQQEKILLNLNSEYEMLMNELDDINEEITKNELQVNEGIPEQAYSLESPNEELKVSILQEFFIIDFKYKEKLDHLNKHYKDLLELNEISKNGGWETKNDEYFQHLYEQYHSHSINLANCNFTVRDLMFDRMKRTFQFLNGGVIKLDRNDFVKHEEYNDSNKFYHQQYKLIINEWKEAKRGFMVKAETILAEAFDMIEKDRVKKEEKEKQLKICIDLYEKVIKWRNQKLEALEIQQKIDEMIRKQNEEKSKIENERNNRIKQEQKQAIIEYKKRLEANKKQMELEEKQRIEKNNKHLTQKDKERVDMRNKEIMNKKVQQKANKLKEIRENEEKELRMKKFYDSVKPNVQFDPARLVSFTQAELNRRGISHQVENRNDKYADQKQLFQNYSFNDKQLNKDARTRIENRLREAGLINSDYAKSIINNIQSMVPQARRDLKENFNWNNFND